MRVYVVDDEPPVRRMVARMVAGEDVEVQEFPSAAAFLEVLDALPFGCVLLDVRMPDYNGLDVLSEVLRRQPFPVVMVSGSTDMDDAICSFRRGAVHFLRKPFDRQTLLTALSEARIVGLERKVAADRQAEASRVKLTAREQEVLGAMMEGRHSKSIAWELGLSIRTVDMHRSNILNKLHAKNASHAVAIARTLRLIPDGAAAA